MGACKEQAQPGTVVGGQLQRVNLLGCRLDVVKVRQVAAGSVWTSDPFDELARSSPSEWDREQAVRLVRLPLRLPDSPARGGRRGARSGDNAV